MDANQTSDLVLSFIKRSNLNFNIVESPFSLSIPIKKTFIKNKDGTMRKSGLNATSMEETSVDQKFSSVQLSFVPSQQDSIPTFNPQIQHQIQKCLSNPQILPMSTTQTLVSRHNQDAGDVKLEYQQPRLPYPP